MKILYLAARQPYPPLKGDQVIAYEQIKRLKQSHEIVLVSFYKEDKEALYEEMKQHCKRLVLIRDGVLGKIFGALKTLWNRQSIQVNLFYRRDVARLVKTLIAEEGIEQIHVNSFRMARYAMDVRAVNKSIDLIDACSYNMLLRKNQSSFVTKWLWGLENKLLIGFEREILGEFSVKTVVAERDKAFIGDPGVIVNHLGIEVKERVASAAIYHPDTFNMIFHGNLSYYANIEAIEYLIDRIFIPLKEKNPDVRLYLVGAKPSRRIKELLVDGVVLVGYVEDMLPYIQSADLAIYPLLTATGTQLKVLESLAAKVPTIISQEVANGLWGVESGRQVMIAHTADEFISRALEVMTEGFDRSILERGLAYVRREYSWDRHVERLEKLWEAQHESLG